MCIGVHEGCDKEGCDQVPGGKRSTPPQGNQLHTLYASGSNVTGRTCTCVHRCVRAPASQDTLHRHNDITMTAPTANHTPPVPSAVATLHTRHIHLDPRCVGPQ